MEMHLANGDHTLHYGGITQEKAEVKTNNNTMDIDEGKTFTNGQAQTNGHSTKVNEVDITLLEDLDPDAWLDAVLTAWAILVQRYQRDVFHQFSWGIKEPGSEKLQCISASDLDLLSHSNAATLAGKIHDLRLKNVSLDGATVFLNDGTKEEV